MSNRTPFQKAIRSLPGYEPSPGLWDRIQVDLDRREALQRAIRELPAYAPSPGLWDRIESELPRPRFARWRNEWAAAAALLVLAVALSLLWPGNQPDESIAFTTVQLPGRENLQWELPPDDEEAIREVTSLFTRSVVARQSADYDLLQNELDELNTAKQELEEILHTYGMDPALINQLKDIELQRSEVVKRMATHI